MYFWVIFYKKYLLVDASGMLWTGQWIGEWVSEWVSACVRAWVSEWVRDVRMSHQSDWIYYEQPIKFVVVKVNGTWETQGMYKQKDFGNWKIKSECMLPVCDF